jgi:hypothetical protein
VLLNEVEGQARQRGWLVISETASSGFVDRITRQHLPALLASLDPTATETRLKGITGPLGIGGATWETLPKHVVELGLRNQIQLLTDILAEYETGVLITLDEVHARQIEELREFATTVQHAFREERQLVFVGAGLSAAVSDVINDDVLTFLRRADRHHLGTVGLDDVRRALAEPIEASGRRIDRRALDVMAAGTRGYPFLIQLVGSHSWRRSTGPVIVEQDARESVARALRRLGSLVHEPALADASAVDRSFLLAMAQDDGPSRMADVRQRLEITNSYASQYRLRLIASELIHATAHGYVDFTYPYLREYLREHAAAGI